MRAAQQLSRADPQLALQRREHRHMLIRAAVRGAHQRQLAVVQAEALHPAAFHQRQRLKRLGRRAQEDQRFSVARARQQPALRVAHGDGAVMDGFDNTAARGFYQGDIMRVGHKVSSGWLV